MKRLLIYILTFIGAASAHAADGDLFPYPQPPAYMERLDERCDYIISQFWRQCDIKSALSKSDKLSDTFGDWVALMPYATADTVHSAINRLLSSVSKDGRSTLALAKLAERFVYSDSAELRSAEIFLPFAHAASTAKKISPQDKEHFASLVRKLENAQQGKPVKHLVFTTPEGNKQSLDNYHTQMIVLFFNKHDDSESSMARVRLSADYNINTFIDKGLLTIMSIEPGAANSEWLQATTSYPANWVVGASADASDWFELDTMPTMLLLDGRHKVLAKGLTVEGLMATIDHMRRQSGI